MSERARRDTVNYDNASLVVGSIEVGFRVEGSQNEYGPSVVLLHGLNSHSGTWRKTMPALAEQYRVLAPSLPMHHGRAVSSELASHYAGLVRELVESLRMKDVAVIGNSMGGWTAMKLASIVSKVVLEDTAGAESPEAAALLEQQRERGLPTLIVWGADDTVIPVSRGRSLHERIPGSRLRVIQGCGHVPHWEEPEVFNKLVKEFLSS